MVKVASLGAVQENWRNAAERGSIDEITFFGSSIRNLAIGNGSTRIARALDAPDQLVAWTVLQVLQAASDVDHAMLPAAVRFPRLRFLHTLRPLFFRFGWRTIRLSIPTARIEWDPPSFPPATTAILSSASTTFTHSQWIGFRRNLNTACPSCAGLLDQRFQDAERYTNQSPVVQPN
jgi:hypothetical protein